MPPAALARPSGGLGTAAPAEDQIGEKAELNPESIKIYARMTEQEYASWVDKLMKVKRIDTARTTSLPVMDMADAIAMWGDQLKADHAPLRPRRHVHNMLRRGRSRR